MPVFTVTDEDIMSPPIGEVFHAINIVSTYVGRTIVIEENIGEASVLQINI